MRYFTKLINRLRRFTAEKCPFHTFIASKIDDFPSKQTNTFWMTIITDRGNRLESGKITDGRGCYSKRRRRREKARKTQREWERANNGSLSLLTFVVAVVTRLSFTLGLCHSHLFGKFMISLSIVFQHSNSTVSQAGARTHFQNRLSRVLCIKNAKGL